MIIKQSKYSSFHVKPSKYSMEDDCTIEKGIWR